ncbi:MAG TPA: glycosyltransferase family 4 protein [Tianweitania sediminis]|nr:glycosyltransferase family 4 protein [Tianweitania sediminis]
MTMDAVGGVWRYGLDLAASLQPHGITFVFVGFGPRPSSEQRHEAEKIGKLIWQDAKLEWLAKRPAELDDLPRRIEALVKAEGIDLLHLNAPSQAAGLSVPCPVVVVSHSCVITWLDAVRSQQPGKLLWQKRLNRAGFDAANAVLAPSSSHAEALERSYGPIRSLSVVHNASKVTAGTAERQPFVFAAGRWWDEGKNGAVLDAVGNKLSWPVRLAGSVKGPNGERIRMRNADHLGTLSSSEVQEVMARAGIFVSPSIYEPFGLAPLEAAAAGAPLVLSDIPTYRELWDGAALFAAPRDPDAFVAALDGLIASPSQRQEFGRKALLRAKRYSASAQAEAMMAIYTQVQVPAERPLVLSN